MNILPGIRPLDAPLPNETMPRSGARRLANGAILPPGGFAYQDGSVLPPPAPVADQDDSTTTDYHPHDSEVS